jgi:hypothetical protein
MIARSENPVIQCGFMAIETFPPLLANWALDCLVNSASSTLTQRPLFLLPSAFPRSQQEVPLASSSLSLVQKTFVSFDTLLCATLFF